MDRTHLVQSVTRKKVILNERISKNTPYTLTQRVQKWDQAFGLEIGKSSVHQAFISLR